MRYDAAIIGAGANGLAAAATLGRAGLKVIVLDRATVCGGRAATREFHPGFRASPFTDEIAPVPGAIFRDLDLARLGAIFVPSPSSLALWPEKKHDILYWHESDDFSRLRKRLRETTHAILAKANGETSAGRTRRWFGPLAEASPWPTIEWSRQSLADACAAVGDEARASHLVSIALAGRAVDPFLGGSALNLLTSVRGGTTVRGLATFAGALVAAAGNAGAEISTGLEVEDIHLSRGRATGLHLADGTLIEARSVISTLDLRRTFFSLFAWQSLPSEVGARVSCYRHSGGRARLLLALNSAPSLAAEFKRGPVHVAPNLAQFAKAHDAWRDGVVPEHPPLVLRFMSAADPRLAPQGKAVLTATLGCIPHHLFDGGWTNEKRTALRDSVLAQIETVIPGVAASVVGSELILPSDIEKQLGVTEGDLDGGEIAPDQMFAQRGFPNCSGGRTPLLGLYLGGMSSPAGPLGSCAAGVMAAKAVLADLGAELLP
ncbi:MAG TPA: NAD(P)/FAD-dependent oxidoreductase [Rhizomicrobium sp.]|nr:NAD(P)/FAD-dependent oxidoreductase [Rhizomicrobium sp.]